MRSLIVVYYLLLLIGCGGDGGSTSNASSDSGGSGSSDSGNGDSGSSSDTTAPTFSGAKSVSAASTASITTSWDAASDNSSATSAIVYDIYQAKDDIEGESYTTTSYTTSAGATSYTVTELDETTTYYFVVRARDAAGNRDTNTTEVVATTKSSDANTSSPVANNSTPSLITYTTQGTTVYGLFYRPTICTSSNPCAVILYTFGGGGSQNLCSHWHNACDISTGQSLGCGNGTPKYAVFVVGNRGDNYTPSGDCTGSTVTSGGSESRWRGDVNDYLAAIEWLKTKNFINTSQIGLFGESVGGNNALLLATRSSDIKAVVTWSAHYDLAYIYNMWVSDNSINIGWKNAALGGCAPTDSDACAKEYRIRSAATYKAKLTMPIQHSHCTTDSAVPYQVSQQLYDYMNTAGKLNVTYTFNSYDGSVASSDAGSGCQDNNHGGAPGTGNPWKGLALTRLSSFFDNNL